MHANPRAKYTFHSFIQLPGFERGSAVCHRFNFITQNSDNSNFDTNKNKNVELIYLWMPWCFDFFITDLIIKRYNIRRRTEFSIFHQIFMFYNSIRTTSILLYFEEILTFLSSFDQFFFVFILFSK